MTNEATESDAVKRVENMVYMATRAAMADELCTYHESTIIPLLETIFEISNSLKMVIQGQALVERHLAELTGPHDDEPWRESLGDD